MLQSKRVRRIISARPRAADGVGRVDGMKVADGAHGADEADEGGAGGAGGSKGGAGAAGSSPDRSSQKAA